MEIDLPVIEKENNSNPLHSTSLDDKEDLSILQDESENYDKENDITESSLYITACETPNVLDFEKKTELSDSLSLVDKFEIDSYVKEKDGLAGSIASEPSLVSDSILNNDIVDENLDATLLGNPGMHFKGPDSKKDDQNFFDSNPTHFQKALSSDVGISISDSFHGRLESLVSHSSDNEEKGSHITLDPTVFLKKTSTIETSGATDTKGFTTTLEKSSLCEASDDDLEIDSDRGSISSDFSSKINKKSIQNNSTHFIPEKLSVGPYMDDSINMNILDLEKFEIPSGGENIADSQSISHFIVANDHTENLLSTSQVDYPKFNHSDCDAKADSNEHLSIHFSTRDSILHEPVFVSTEINAKSLHDSSEEHEKDLCLEKNSSVAIQNSQEAKSKLILASRPKFNTKEGTSAKIEIKANFYQKLQTKPKVLPIKKPDPSSLTRKVKQKLNEMVTTTQVEEEEVIKQFIIMKEEKMQVLQDILIEIERLDSKYMLQPNYDLS